jgi:hypothetical protein
VACVLPTGGAARVTDAYVEQLGVEIHDDAPISRDLRGNLYTIFSLARDFRLVRKAEFGDDEKRRLMDMRRSGAVEENAGGVDPLALADKMANSIDSSGKLQDTYLPRRVAVVRRADAARKRGRQALRENEWGSKAGKRSLESWNELPPHQPSH